MHRWAKRGLQAALVTGGMFVLGVGVASAAEACPDRPCTPLDSAGSLALPQVRVPVNVADNAIGTPVGQVDVPAVHEEVGTREINQILAVVPLGVPGPIGSNKVGADLLVPVGAHGNAVALGGPVTVTSNSGSTYSEPQHLATSGQGGALAGNAVGVNGAIPVALDGNAAGLAGSAHSYNNSVSEANTSGSIYTDGDSASLSGNAVYLPAAIPIKATGNAIGLAGGNAYSDSYTNTSAVSGSAVTTSGDESTGSGNVLTVPVAQPLGFAGNALGAAGGHEHVSSGDTSYAQAGGNTATHGDNSTLSGNLAGAPVGNPFAVDGNAGGLITNAATQGQSQDASVAGGSSTSSGSESLLAGNVASVAQAFPIDGTGNAIGGLTNGHSTYGRQVNSTSGGPTATTGDGSNLSGNAARVPVAGPLDIMDNGGGLISNATTSGISAASISVGGSTSTTGNGSLASGSVAGTPIGVPIAGTGNGGGLMTNTHTAHNGFTASNVGGDTSTAGNGSTLSGVIADTPVATPGTVASNIGGVATNGTAGGSSDQNDTVGGMVHTAGIDSTASGDVAHLPASVPVGDFGNVNGVLVNGTANHATRQYGQAGGGTYTRGDGSLGSGTVAGIPASVPVGDFGNLNGVLVNGSAQGSNAATGAAGGFTGSNGQEGTASGDIVRPAAAVPVQTFGSAVGVLLNGRGDATNNTTSTAGDPGASTVDDAGTLTSNVLAPQVTGPAQAFANSGGVLSHTVGQASNNTAASAGGPTKATGLGGAVAGNVAALPFALPTQAFGNAVPVASNSTGLATSDTSSTAGGPVASDGSSGSLSGNVFDIPAKGPVQGFGDAVSVGGVGDAAATSQTGSAAGGAVTTLGESGSFAGSHVYGPLDAMTQEFGQALAVGGTAHGLGSHVTHGQLGGGAPTLTSQTIQDGQLNELPPPMGSYLHYVPAQHLGQAIHESRAARDEGTAAVQKSGLDLPVGADKLLQAAELPVLPPLGGLTNIGASGLPIGAPALGAGKPGGSARSLTPQFAVPVVGDAHLPSTGGALPMVGDAQLPLPLGGGAVPVLGNAQLPLTGGALPVVGDAQLPLPLGGGAVPVVGNAHLPLGEGVVPSARSADLPLGDGAVPFVDGPILGNVFAQFGAADLLRGHGQERAAGGSVLGLPEGSVPALSALDGATILRELTNLRKDVHPSEG